MGGAELSNPCGEVHSIRTVGGKLGYLRAPNSRQSGIIQIMVVAFDPVQPLPAPGILRNVPGVEAIFLPAGIEAGVVWLQMQFA
jgi:hypothetical protein